MKRLLAVSGALLLILSCAAVPGTGPGPAAAASDSGSAASPTEPASPPAPEGSPRPEAAFLAGPAAAVVFTSAAILPADAAVPAAVGSAGSSGKAWTGDISLTAAFVDAYREALFRGVPLKGALGGDAVHPWTAAGASAKASGTAVWAQNWRDDGKAANSWGLPGLVVAAVGGSGGRVCIVRGRLLDAYGRGGGVSGANGVAGYGAPLGDEYAVDGGTAAGGAGLAQRFELGLLSVSAEGRASFVPGAPPSAAGVPEGVGEFGSASAPASFPATGRTAFREAWKSAADSGLAPGAPDGPVGAVSGLFFQTFGGGTWALALPVGTDFPFGLRARRLSGAILARYLASGGWSGGLAAYGPPLADPALRGDGGAEQRFLKGVMAVPAAGTER